jgi:hypothetical protein
VSTLPDTQDSSTEQMAEIRRIKAECDQTAEIRRTKAEMDTAIARVDTLRQALTVIQEADVNFRGSPGFKALQTLEDNAFDVERAARQVYIDALTALGAMYVTSVGGEPANSHA